MEYTPNFNLKKPAQGDVYNVDDFNDNIDIIDENLSAVSIVDNLTSVSAESALSANQGRILNELKAPVASPLLTGIPAAPTPPTGTNTSQIATTAYVMNTFSAISPPGDVTDFMAVPDNAQVTLTWGDPPDGTLPIVNWAGTLIVRKPDSYPIDENDGTLVVDSQIRNQYQSTGLIDGDLINGITYYYQSFPYSDTGAMNRNIANRVSATPKGIPTFTYTGTSILAESIHPTTGAERFYMSLLSSGTLTSDMDAEIDVFLVSGGGSGKRYYYSTDSGAYGGGGGAGAYTENYYGESIISESEIAVVIGSGGSAVTSGNGSSSAGGATVFGVHSRNGPTATTNNVPTGVSGGSGGGAAGRSFGVTQDSGGAGGTNGGSGNSTTNSAGGAGQGISTRPFLGDVAPFASMQFAGGGGGGGGNAFSGTYTAGGVGGSGGGGRGGRGQGTAGTAGTSGRNGTAGTANTGGGGGGSGGYYDTPATNTGSSGAGGSGIVIIRWGDWSE